MEHIEYELTEEDISAFATHFSRHAPLLVKHTRLWRLILGGWALLIVTTSQVLPNARARRLPDALMAAFGLAGFLLYPRYVSWFNRRSILRNYRSARADVVYGRVVLELKNGVLSKRQGRGYLEVAVADLDRIEVSDTHVFVYLTPFSTIDIPRHRILGGDLDAFVSSLRQTMSKSVAR